MTIIVALKDGATIYMGGDRNRISGSRAYPGLNPKVWKITDAFGNQWVWGQTGSCNLQQVARYGLPELKDNAAETEDLCGFIFRNYIPVLYDEAKKLGGIVRPDSKTGDNLEGSFVVGVLGKVFRLAGLAVTELDLPFFTAGSGEGPAHGALDAIHRHDIVLSPEDKIRSAITAACSMFPNLGGGIDIVHS